MQNEHFFQNQVLSSFAARGRKINIASLDSLYSEIP